LLPSQIDDRRENAGMLIEPSVEATLAFVSRWIEPAQAYISGHVIGVAPEEKQRARDGHEPASGVKLSVGRLPDEVTDDASDHRAADTQPDGEPESKRNGAGKNPAGKDADNEADDNGSDNAQDTHKVFSSINDIAAVRYAQAGDPSPRARRSPSTAVKGIASGIAIGIACAVAANAS
jgi:hypothetical protein